MKTPSRQAVLGIDNGAFFHGSRKVFAGISFLLDDARTALVGENGVGKSTLLKCLSGELELNGGKVVKSRGLRVGYLAQEVPEGLAALVGENGVGKSTLLKCLSGELELNAGKVVKSRGLRVGYLAQEVPEGLAALSVREVLERSLERAGAAGEDWRIDVMLDEIGVAPDVAEGAFGALSGGWQRLVLIAGAARLEAPDILILDEPTNHLDLAAINTLEGWLAEDFRMPMLIVSHDRAFLDRVSTRTLFLRPDGAHAFKTPFAQAREQLLRRDAAAGVRRDVEDKEIKRLEAVAARYKVWGVKNSKFHKRQHATERRIARVEAEKTQVYSGRERRLELGDADLDAKVVLRIAGLKLAAPDGRPLLAIDRLNLAAGDRIALLGVNGAGKTTLLNALAAAWAARSEHYDGVSAIRFNPGCRLAYFDQTMGGLPLNESLLGYLVEQDGAVERDAIRSLAQAGFDFKRVREPIGLLSQGERSRLVFLKMKLARPNLYLLDEPTSHLDIEGQEALEAQLEETDVACVFVSHDRWFTKAAASRFLEIRKGRLVEVEDPDAFFDARIL